MELATHKSVEVSEPGAEALRQGLATSDVAYNVCKGLIFGSIAFFLKHGPKLEPNYFGSYGDSISPLSPLAGVVGQGVSHEDPRVAQKCASLLADLIPMVLRYDAVENDSLQIFAYFGTGLAHPDEGVNKICAKTVSDLFVKLGREGSITSCDCGVFVNIIGENISRHSTEVALMDVSILGALFSNYNYKYSVRGELVNANPEIINALGRGLRHPDEQVVEACTMKLAGIMVLNASYEQHQQTVEILVAGQDDVNNVVKEASVAALDWLVKEHGIYAGGRKRPRGPASP